MADDAPGRPIPVRLPVQNERSDPPGRFQRSRYVYLLDVDEDLAAEFEMMIRIAVRPVMTARVTLAASSFMRWKSSELRTSAAMRRTPSSRT